MKITNETHWRTDQIAKLIYRVAKDELDPGQLKNARIRVKYRRGGGTGGYCYYGSARNPNVRMTLTLPRDRVFPVTLAHVIAHELGHAKGLHHGPDMNNARYGWKPGWQERYAYAKDFPVEVKPKVLPVPKEEKLVAKRTAALVKAQKKVQEWETAIKRANTMLRKWRVRLRAAEKRQASSTSAVPAPPAESSDQALAAHLGN